jgi:hypothetical protein
VGGGRQLGRHPIQESPFESLPQVPLKKEDALEFSDLKNLNFGSKNLDLSRAESGFASNKNSSHGTYFDSQKIPYTPDSPVPQEQKTPHPKTGHGVRNYNMAPHSDSEPNFEFVTEHELAKVHYLKSNKIRTRIE